MLTEQEIMLMVKFVNPGRVQTPAPVYSSPVQHMPVRSDSSLLHLSSIGRCAEMISVKFEMRKIHRTMLNLRDLRVFRNCIMPKSTASRSSSESHQVIEARDFGILRQTGEYLWSPSKRQLADERTDRGWSLQQIQPAQVPFSLATLDLVN